MMLNIGGGGLERRSGKALYGVFLILLLAAVWALTSCSNLWLPGNVESGTAPDATLAVSISKAPTGVSASDDAYTDRVRVAWTASTGATSYEVWRNTSNNTSSAAKINTTTVTSSPYYDMNVTAGTTYYYWVKAANSAGKSSFSTVDSGRCKPLAAPTGVSASDGTYTDKVRVTWTASTGATSYEVWRNTSNIWSSAIKINTVTSSPYDDTSATPGTTYDYRVKAKNTAGTSGFSAFDAGRRAPVPTLTVKPDRLSYNAGIGWVQFNGQVKDAATGVPLPGVTIGVDDSLKAVCQGSVATTGPDGTFSYRSTIPTSAKGNYEFTFYGGKDPVFVAVYVSGPQQGITLKDTAQTVPLGVTSSKSSLNLPLTLKSTSALNATQSQLADTSKKIGSFVAASATNALTDYVSNPVNVFASLAVVGCAVGIWTGVATIPCAALYTFVAVNAGISTVVGTVNAAIDKTSMPAADKTNWKNGVKTGKCVIAIWRLDPASVLAPISSAWTCGSAVSTLTQDGKARPVLQVTGTSASSSDLRVTGFVLVKTTPGGW